MGLKIGRIFKAVATGGLSEVYESNKGGIGRFLGKEDRDQAAKLATQAEEQRLSAQAQEARAMDIQAERRQAETQYLQQESDRYDSIYKPIEERLGSELAAGPNTEEAAGIAGGNFANEFDASVAARDRNDQRQGVNYRAGSSAGRMQGENDAYNRARGIATSQTDARREEDDQHFLRSNAFYNANGSGIRGRLLQGMQEMYGADANAALGQAGRTDARANQNQAFSTQLNEGSYDGIKTLVNLGTRIGGAIATGGATEAVGAAAGAAGKLGVGGGGATGVDVSQFTGGGQLGAASKTASIGTGAVNPNLFANTNNYLGGSPTGQAFGAYGDVQSQINR